MINYEFILGLIIGSMLTHIIWNIFLCIFLYNIDKRNNDL